VVVYDVVGLSMAMQVYFAHSQPCCFNRDGSHYSRIAALLKHDLEVEIVVKLDYPSVTPTVVAEFLSQFCLYNDASEEDTEPIPEWSKSTLVVVDLSVVQDPIGVQSVIHDSLTKVPDILYFLILQPLLPTACSFCPCSDWHVAQ